MEASTRSVIESLADKLAAADLTDAEVDLLRTLLADDDADVTGFSIGSWGPILTAGASTKGWIGPGATLSPQKILDDDIGLLRGGQKLLGDDIGSL